MSLQIGRPGAMFPAWVKWLAAAIAVLVVFALLAGGLGFRWDPFNRAERRAERAEASAETAADQASASRHEAAGNADQVHRVETATRTILQTQAATEQAAAAARSAPDANDPLDPDRAARLRDHDRELCRLSPGLGGCGPAAPGAAEGGG